MLNATASPHSRRARIIYGAACVLLALLGGLALSRDKIADRFVDPAPTVPPATTSDTLSKEERTFYDYIAPRLANVSAETYELVRLASGRSRNIIELQTRGARVETGSREIDDYLSEHGTPARFVDAIRDYRQGIAAIRVGIDDARSGVLSFDWDQVALAVSQFEDGATRLTSALDALHQAGRTTLPTAATPNP